TAQLVRINLSTGSVEPIAQDSRYDILSFAIDHRTGQLDHYVTASPDPSHPALRFGDPRDNQRLSYLTALLPGRITTVERNPAEDILLIGIDFDRQQGQAVLFDWPARSVIGSLDLLTPRAIIEQRMPEVATRFVEIPTRDGVTLDGFLTVPRSGSPDASP